MTWGEVHQLLALLPTGYRATLRRGDIVHPEAAGASRSAGLEAGVTHWRWPPDEQGRGLHAHEQRDSYVVHLDARHPDRGMLDHLVLDAPTVVLGAGLVAGALVGWRRGGSLQLLAPLGGVLLAGALVRR